MSGWGCSPEKMIGFLSAEPRLPSAVSLRSAARQPKATRSGIPDQGTAQRRPGYGITMDDALSRPKGDRLPSAAAKRQRAVHRTNVGAVFAGTMRQPYRLQVAGMTIPQGVALGWYAVAPSGHRIQGEPVRRS